MKKIVVEMAPFTLAEGVTEKMLLDASSVLQEDFLSNQPGFIKRELLKRSHHEWLDVVYWKDAQSADEAVKNSTNSPVCHMYFQLMIGEDHMNPGNGVKHYERISEY